MLEKGDRVKLLRVLDMEAGPDHVEGVVKAVISNHGISQRRSDVLYGVEFGGHFYGHFWVEDLAKVI